MVILRNSKKNIFLQKQRKHQSNELPASVPMKMRGEQEFEV